MKAVRVPVKHDGDAKKNLSTSPCEGQDLILANFLLELFEESVDPFVHLASSVL